MQLLKCGALSINEMIKINADLVKSNVKQLIPCDNLKELVMNELRKIYSRTRSGVYVDHFKFNETGMITASTATKTITAQIQLNEYVIIKVKNDKKEIIEKELWFKIVQ